MTLTLASTLNFISTEACSLDPDRDFDSDVNRNGKLESYLNPDLGNDLDHDFNPVLDSEINLALPMSLTFILIFTGP